VRLISFRVTGWTLIRFVSASAGRIALSATLTTSQPPVALPVVVDSLAQQFLPTVPAVRQAAGNGGTASARDRQTPMPGPGEPPSGWG